MSEIRKHELKIWPEYYEKVADGSKTFEVRINDRDFRPGDEVELREWEPGKIAYDDEPPTYGRYTSLTSLKFKIGYVLPIDDKRVVFSLLPLEAQSE